KEKGLAQRSVRCLSLEIAISSVAVYRQAPARHPFGISARSSVTIATVVFVSYSISLSAGFISAATTPARQKTTPPADPPRLAPAHKEVVKGSSLVAPAVIAPMETPNPTTLKDIAFKQTSKPHTAAEGSQVATPITIAPLKEPAEPAESQTKRLLE